MILVTRPWRPPWTLCFSIMMSSRNPARQRRRSRKISRMPRLQRGHHLTHFYYGQLSLAEFILECELGLEQDRSGAPTIRFLYEQFEDFVEKSWLAVVESFALGGGCQLLCIVLFADLFGCRRQRMVCPRSRPTRPAKRQPRAPGNLLPDRTARPRARRGLPAPGPAQALFRH